MTSPIHLRRQSFIAGVALATSILAAIVDAPAVAGPISPITWSGTRNIAGDSDVINTGALVYAYNFTFVDSLTTGPVNGVVFQPFGVPFDSQTVTVGSVTISEPDPRRLYANGFTTSSAPFSTLSPDYQSLLGTYVIANDPLQITLALGGLTPGTAYDFQWWTNPNYAGNRTTANTVDSTSPITLESQISPVGDGQIGQYAIGRFTASSTSYSILFSGATGSDRPIINGFQLRTSPALIWNTTTGTWNTSNTVWTTGTGGTLAFTNGDSVTFSGTGGGVVTLSGSIQPSAITVSATSGTYTFVSSAGNLLTGTTGLAKSGGGTLILSGSNAFTGTTAITGGSLLVNGVLSSTTTTVSGGLLGGSGTVSGAVQLAAGGTIAPGAAPGGTGILTLGSLSGTGATFAMDISGTGAGQYDRLVTGGNLDYSGNTLQLSMSGTYADGTAWDLFDFTTQSGTFAGISPIVADSAYNGLTWGLASSSSSLYDQRYGAGIWLSSWGSNGQRFIFNQADGALTVVPEPSTFVMAGVGIAGCALLQWRRARRRAGDAAAKTA